LLFSEDIEMIRLLQPVLLSSIIILFPFFTTNVKACQCAESEIPVCAEYWRAKAVFEGLVTEISPPPNEHGVYPQSTIVSLLVEKVHRGTIGNNVIDAQGSGADCRIVYEKGKRYLIYVFGYSPQDNRIQTSACSRSREINHAGEDLGYIRSLAQGFNESSLRGKVLEWHNPLKGVQIEVEGSGKKYRTATDDAGRFAFKLIEPGKYRLRAIGPEKSGFTTLRRDGKFFERNGRPVLEFEEEVYKGGCAYVEFNLYIDRGKKQ
jgi:carboxypeptidase family protein